MKILCLEIRKTALGFIFGYLLYRPGLPKRFMPGIRRCFLIINRQFVNYPTTSMIVGLLATYDKQIASFRNSFSGTTLTIQASSLRFSLYAKILSYTLFVLCKCNFFMPTSKSLKMIWFYGKLHKIENYQSKANYL